MKALFVFQRLCSESFATFYAKVDADNHWSSTGRAAEAFAQEFGSLEDAAQFIAAAYPGFHWHPVARIRTALGKQLSETHRRQRESWMAEWEREHD